MTGPVLAAALSLAMAMTAAAHGASPDGGDGISDGVEVQTGSDPLDLHSFNLAAALSSITVTPAAFRLIFNTVDGESSRQLQAVGNVIDGRTIDMFNPL